MELDSVGQWILAVGALGAASYGLVDATKAFWGGPSRVGFGGIRKVIGDLLAVQNSGSQSLLSRKVLLDALKANWINGVGLDDQKEMAKSFVREQLTETTAAHLAQELGLDAALLTAVGIARAAGACFSPQEQATSTKFDYALSVVVDEAYQRGDQAYRNFAKLLATLFGVILSGIGGYFVSGRLSFCDYVSHSEFGKSLLVGLLAAPLAPVSKDMASVLQAFAKVANLPKK